MLGNVQRQREHVDGQCLFSTAKLPQRRFISAKISLQKNPNPKSNLKKLNPNP